MSNEIEKKFLRPLIVSVGGDCCWRRTLAAKEVWTAVTQSAVAQQTNGEKQ